MNCHKLNHLNVGELKYETLCVCLLLQVDHVDRSYRLLGIMWEENKRLHEEQSQFRSLAGFLENDRRLKYNDETRLRMVL